MPERYVVLDLETTGLSAMDDRILEIGAVRVEHGQITERFETFVNPSRKIPERITELTGITDEMIIGAPDPGKILPEFFAWIGDAPIVGHHIEFDYSFLKAGAMMLRIPFEAKAIDTLKIARMALPELPSRSLESLCSYFKIPRGRGHRALDDVLETQELYRILEERFSGEHAEWFLPRELHVKTRKISPITPAQKRYLSDLIRMHQIPLTVEIDSLTKNEASRMIDTILREKGRNLFHGKEY